MTAPDVRATNGNAAAAPSAPTADSMNAHATADQASIDWWYQLDQRVYGLVKRWIEEHWWPSQRGVLIEAVGELFGTHRATVREAITRLKERIVRLEAASNFEERFNRLASEVKQGSDIPQSELLAKIETLQRQVDLKGVADFDFRELVDRVTELQKTNSLAERFSQLEHQLTTRQGTLLSQDQLLEKIEAQQRQVDELKRIADVDAHVRELAERVGELEKTNSLEARFAKLANEVCKRESEIPHSALLIKIEDLHHQFDELKKVAAQPRPPGRLPVIKVFERDKVYYAGDVVVHDGSCFQALKDTGRGTETADWICIARRGRDAISPTVRGTYDVYETYKQLDIVALDGAAFIAKKNAPGICPGDGWQLMSRQGRQGRRGETVVGPRGVKGEKGDTAAMIVAWQLDREQYSVSPRMSDEKVGPTMELRGLFEQFIAETGLLDERDRKAL